eukprot:gb/GFBE01021744.1/.p1 GENE.gb/GFBE01021744.1/~~gb/GFBE01021744.1/.p1  ORF type:complete len:199 (+),score=66.30 gb/GFBE01021744.1/:1-597(+)
MAASAALAASAATRAAAAAARAAGHLQAAATLVAAAEACAAAASLMGGQLPTRRQHRGGTPKESVEASTAPSTEMGSDSSEELPVQSKALDKPSAARARDAAAKDDAAGHDAARHSVARQGNARLRGFRSRLAGLNMELNAAKEAESVLSAKLGVLQGELDAAMKAGAASAATLEERLLCIRKAFKDFVPAHLLELYT